MKDAIEAALFAKAPHDALVGEATPEYLLLPGPTIRNIRRLYGVRANELRSIAILRNPVDRIWSNYWMMIRDGYEDLPFAEAIAPATISSRLTAGWHPSYDYIGYGWYGRQLTEYVNAFGKDRVAVVLFDDFLADPLGTCASLFSFLTVDARFRPDVSVQHNPSGALRHRALHQWLFTRETVVKQLARRVISNDRLQGLKSAIIRWNSRKVPMPPRTRSELISLYADDIAALSRLIDRDLAHWLRV